MFGMPPFIFVFVVFIGRGVIICMKEGISIGMICSLTFFVFLEYIILFLLREVKYIIIDKGLGYRLFPDLFFPNRKNIIFASQIVER
jgi:hypothetical protein